MSFICFYEKQIVTLQTETDNYKNIIVMKKTILTIIAAFALPAATLADGYATLWKQYEEAKKKDLPKTQIKVLDNIATLAIKEKSYGNLLNAEIKRMNAMADISPDSTLSGIKAFEQKAKEAEGKDEVLASIYYCVLGDTYSTIGNNSVIEDSETKGKEAFDKALKNTKLLAETNALGYRPLVKEGSDGKIFNHDLLNIIGYKARRFKLLNSFYDKTGNRKAALLTAFENVKDEEARTYRYDYSYKAKGNKYIARLDSLMDVYGDLPECGDVALEKYEMMRKCQDVTAAQKADFISFATKKWETWRNIPRLKSEYDDLTKPMFTACLHSAIRPGRIDSIAVETRNIKEVRIAVTRLDAKGNITLNAANASDMKKIRQLMIGSSRIEISTPCSCEHAYDVKGFNIALPKLKPGIYLAEVSTDNKGLKTKREIIAVSDMYVASMYLPDGKARIAVLNATTGQPVAGAKVEVEDFNGKTQVVAVGNDGETTISCNKTDIGRIRAYTAYDNYMPYTGAWGKFTYYGNERKYSNTALFTDRAVYRPGQTVHASAIAYDIDGLHSTKVASGKELTFQLYNANNKVVGEKKATTDDYGTAAIDFTLPEGNTMGGQFSVRCTGNGNERKYFRVEEYKRPTFEIIMDETNREYHNGDTVTVTGKALTYSGTAVQNAKVAYSVKRSVARWFWRYSGNDSDMTLLSDTVHTDDKGLFAVRIPLIMPEGYEEKTKKGENTWQKFYLFTASAQVTDNAGESHDAETSITLGNVPTVLNFDMPDKALKDSTLTVKFNRLNASAKEIDGEVAYWFDQSKEKFSANANTATLIEWDKISGMTSGKHTIWATCGNDTVSREFVLFSIGDKRPATETPDWAYVSSQTFPADGKPVYVQIGSSCEDTHILYSVIAGKKVIESGAYDVSNGIVTTELKYKEEYGEGVLLNYLWVKDGVAYSHKYTVARPLQDKRLDLKWITFRDKLTPGKKETWTLNISRHDANDVINKQYTEKEEKGAQLLAFMYDKSLDQIVKNKFSFNISMWQNLPSTRWNTASWGTNTVGAEGYVKWFNTKNISLDTFDYSLEALRRAVLYSSFNAIGAIEEAYHPVMIRGYGKPLNAKMEYAAEAPMTEALANGEVLRKDSKVENEMADAEPEKNSEEEDNGNGNIMMQVRSNMQETAFFYPALFTDKDGNVDISFTLPESVTTWNFRGLAHDKNMNYGMIESECVASKKIMVMPNMPRFVRCGDRASIATRIANTTDKSVTTNVVMQMIDPLTDKEVYSKTKKLKVEANSTVSTAFEYSTDSDYSLLVCRISASGKDYSDGEQSYLPVLPNTERAMNTIPLTFLTKGEKSISIDSLFPKEAKRKKLTVEFTANPTWLMIQAMPYVAQGNDKNAISLAAAYYSNVLGKYIMDKAPVIKNVVELWKKENTNEGSLASALEKNQELKTLVLDETPWVMDADKETDMKKSLCSFFDESAFEYRISSQLEALKKLQKENGAWSWWQGMDGSPSMTAEIIEMLARLNVMTGDKATASIMSKGMSFLGKVVEKEYDEMMKAKQKGEPVVINNCHAIQYLYINSLLNRTMQGKEKAMKNYLMKWLSTSRQHNIYAKALMAVVLKKDGKTKEAKEYVESIKQYTVCKAETGRYFDTPRAGYSWMDYRIPTQTAAIEAIKAVTPEEESTINEMRLWLLQSKRTQAWDTPINSVNAIYAFMDGKYNELETKEDNGMNIAIDGKKQKLAVPSAGLGYSKTSFEINGQRCLTIAKSSEGTSWGAVYAQFDQNAMDVTNSASGIKVEREIVNIGNNGLSVGQKVKVRITISADRDYDFVQVVDKRAACLEPVVQISNYGWGYYYVPKDNATNYYFDRLAKGKHVIETDYYIDRDGEYTTGTCTVQCAYAPEFTGRTEAKRITIK